MTPPAPAQKLHLYKLFNEAGEAIEKVSPSDNMPKILYRFKQTRDGKNFKPVKIEHVRTETDYNNIINKCSQSFRSNDILPEYVKVGLSIPQCSHIRHFVKNVFNGKYCDSFISPQNVELIEYIKSSSNASTYICSLIKAHDNIYNYNNNQLRLIQKSITKPSEEIPHEKIKTLPFVQSLPTGANDYEKLIISLYRDMLPIRTGVWNQTYLIDDGHNNYLNLKTGKLILRKYKTRSAYGEQIIMIPKNIIKLIKKNKITNKLFKNIKEDIFNIIGIGSNELRHIYVTECLMSGVCDAYQLAHGMQTSREMINDIYFIKEYNYIL